MKVDGEVKTPSYCNTTTNDLENSCSHRPPFEPPPHLWDQYLQDEIDGSKGTSMDAKSSHPKDARVWIPGKCIPQAPVAPIYVIKSSRIGEHTHFMREHSLISNFWVFGPQKRILQDGSRPGGLRKEITSSKGLFTVIFYNLKDKDHIFKSESYFYNSTSLYLHFLTDHLCPEKEYFSYAPVWIRLNSLPQEF